MKCKCLVCLLASLLPFVCTLALSTLWVILPNNKCRTLQQRTLVSDWSIAKISRQTFNNHMWGSVLTGDSAESRSGPQGFSPSLLWSWTRARAVSVIQVLSSENKQIWLTGYLKVYYFDELNLTSQARQGHTHRGVVEKYCSVASLCILELCVWLTSLSELFSWVQKYFPVLWPSLCSPKSLNSFVFYVFSSDLFYQRYRCATVFIKMKIQLGESEGRHFTCTQAHFITFLQHLKKWYLSLNPVSSILIVI